MNKTEFLNAVLTQKLTPLVATTEAEWHTHWQQQGIEQHPPILISALGGALSDRLAWAFASGYQGALHQCFPAYQGSGWRAFLVSEDRKTPEIYPPVTLQEKGGELFLSGYKSWVAGAQHVRHLLIKAGRGEARRFLWLESEAEGVTIDAGKTGAFLQELSQGRVGFDDVRVSTEQFIDGEQGAASFGPTESLHVLTALNAFILSQSLAEAAPLISKATSLLHVAFELAESGLSDKASTLAFAGYDLHLCALANEFEVHLSDTSTTLQDNWQRNKGLVTMYSRGIQQRAELLNN